MLKAHPFADIFPMIDGADFDGFKEDIRLKGQLEPIVLFEGMVLDGRNRLKACLALGLEPNTTIYEGDDPLGFVLSKNLTRRHLTPSQRAVIAARLETLRPGKSMAKPGKDAKLHVSRGEAAKALNVSPRSVADAKKVLETAAVPVVRAVESGALAVDVAAKMSAMPKTDQAALLKRAKTETGVDSRRVKAEIKKARREERERDLGQKQQALPDKAYGVVYADPPWKFEPYSQETGMDRAADNHYPTQSLDVIKSHRPETAKDAVLFLWATAPMLPQALAVMTAWGFAYRSNCVWDKAKPGTGYWFRNQHEILLVGTKGKPPAPGDVPPSVYSERATAHSAKPVFYREVIEELFPNFLKLEMYCRDRAAGWDVWGNEAGGEGRRV